MLISPDWLHWPETGALIRAFNGVPLRFVGGCVRDAVLGRDVKDVDAATPLLPEQVMGRLRENGIKAVPTGIEHGTVTAVVDGKPFEVTTLRRDVSTDGRRATVAYTDDWEEDANRRDFTMNALYCDTHGQVTDYFGGVEDAREGHVRFIGDAGLRITEDALRILRFFRFFAHYGKGEIDADGFAACKAHVALLDKLSGERIQQEMLKLLVPSSAGEVAELMRKGAILQAVMATDMDTTSLKALPPVLKAAQVKPDALLSLALLLRSAADVYKKSGVDAAITARWKLSNAHSKRLSILCENRILPSADAAECKKLIRVFGKSDYRDLVLLHLAETRCSDAGLAAISLARSWEIPEFPVSGDDLKTHGVVQGKAMGETLRKLEMKWEESGYALTKQELIKLVK